MDKRLILFLSFCLAFALGFVAGTFWSSIPAPSSTSQSVTMPPVDTLDLTDMEARIAQALEDPDFKRVHDHLSREMPMQMDLPTKPEPPQERIPMSERPPVKFRVKE